MKKLLTAFAAFGMMATTGATAMTVVSCGAESVKTDKVQKIYDEYKVMTNAQRIEEAKKINKQIENDFKDDQDKVKKFGEALNKYLQDHQTEMTDEKSQVAVITDAINNANKDAKFSSSQLELVCRSIVLGFLF